ncbi:MAG: HdeD family acid-resistance protein [Gammaproteobacteria bacterium]|nr:HdeD family acid-resistance protein [Gammaproteobacteria bacterium]
MNGINQNAMQDFEAVFGDLKRSWGWLLALGILFIVLGTIALGMSMAMTVVTVLFFGVLLLIGGVLQVIDAFKCKGWKSIMLHIAIAGLYLLAGTLLITKPLIGSMAITALLAASFIVIGLLRIFMGFQLKGDGLAWGWVLLAGIVSLVLGAMIFFQWPASALWFIGLLVAVEMIFHGWAYVTIALAIKSVQRNFSH